MQWLGYDTINTIMPFFSSKRRGNDNRNEVSKEKLTRLWLQRRKKAISVIRNNGFWPNIENADISVQGLKIITLSRASLQIVMALKDLHLHSLIVKRHWPL